MTHFPGSVAAGPIQRLGERADKALSLAVSFFREQYVSLLILIFLASSWTAIITTSFILSGGF